MKTSIPVCLLLLCGPVVTGQTNAVLPSRTVDIDGYAARVNDRVIKRSDVLKAATPMLQELYRTYQGAAPEQEAERIIERVRDELVERALIVESFEARGTPIPDQYVNDEIRRIINGRFAGDEARFEQVLSAEKQTREEFMETIRENIALEIMTAEQVDRRVRITPEQVRAAYAAERENYFIPEKVKYSLIVLNRGETPEEQAVKRNEAEQIRKRLLEGADFNETAKAVSEGSRAAEGGAFAWMQPKDARPELQEVLSSLPVGEISEIITTDAELYLVRIEARLLAGYRPFDEVRGTIKTALEAQERARLKSRWIENLKRDSYVMIYK